MVSPRVGALQGVGPEVLMETHGDRVVFIEGKSKESSEVCVTVLWVVSPLELSQDETALTTLPCHGGEEDKKDGPSSYDGRPPQRDMAYPK